MTTKPNDNAKRKVIHIRAYNIKELADIYEVDRRTMTAWLKPHEQAIGEKVGRIYKPLQVKIIFEKLGLPSQIELAD